MIYRDELDALGDDVVLTLTREQRGRHRHAAASTRSCSPRSGFAAEQEPRIFVCGPTPFVEAVASALVGLGHAPERVRTERFGPTGGERWRQLDGNGAAGMLSEVFALEVTGARGRCDGCGNVGALGEARAYVDAPGS